MPKFEMKNEVKFQTLKIKWKKGRDRYGHNGVISQITEKIKSADEGTDGKSTSEHDCAAQTTE